MPQLHVRKLAFSLLLSAGLASPALAQETFTPIFKNPYRPFRTNEFGVSFSDPGLGRSFALEGFYGQAWRGLDVGLRAGIAPGSGGANTAFLVGANARARLISQTESIPVDGALTVGAGVFTGSGTAFTIPVGLTVGRRFEFENSQVSFVPYVHPVVQPVIGDGDDGFKFSLGLGANISLSRNFDVRVSGAIGYLSGVGVSIAYMP